MPSCQSLQYAANETRVAIKPPSSKLGIVVSLLTLFADACVHSITCTLT